ncbi:phospholipase D-like domain-containing protein [Alicyclobacillus tolerans]|uniref:phospholipase D-like domain-containing protein n=1 Tax=Alicyclobacillus tolerans TaxID=90970 RepID=UPI001F24C8D0|nr:phosphatidylserine/phosphatidylglycerophosphate/cardiolipin synthase family protein [Alicyclobacillus tolerans]MCF8565267.1 phospholipase D-like domain-containing protein [Alicyclobacillus tolerans]
MSFWRNRMVLLWTCLTIGVGFVTGCSEVNAVKAASPMPSPVTDRGMTLVWGQDVKAEALQMIQHSRRTCYLDIYELSDPDILNALASAKQRGVDVRVVADATERHSVEQGLPRLQKDGVSNAALQIHHGISHIKMLICDQNVLIGGMNFGAQSWNNNDASVYLPAANPSFLGVFRYDFARAHGQAAAAPGSQLPLIYDRNIQTHVVQAIQSAQNTVYMEAFDLSDYDVVNALKAAAKRGVAVEVLLDPGQSPNRKSSEQLRTAGAVVRFYRSRQGELMHAKILDVDGGKTFIIGSANFSHQAYTYNHEGDLILQQVPRFDKSLEQDIAAQISRGTDYPVRTQRAGA